MAKNLQDLGFICNICREGDLVQKGRERLPSANSDPASDTKSHSSPVSTGPLSFGEVAECAKNRGGGGEFLSFIRKGDGLFNARNRPGKLQYGSSLLPFDLPHFFGVKFYNPKGGSFFQNAATPRRKILRRFARMHGLTLLPRAWKRFDHFGEMGAGRARAA